MHDTVDTAALSKLLNQFSVPMFAVERSGPYATFRFVCTNDAMIHASGRSAQATIGMSAFDLLSVAEAEMSNGRLLECAMTRNVVRYREGFTTAGRHSVWDTTLQFVPLPDGAERVVGTSIQLAPEDAASPEVSQFEDINYFSSMADFQLQNLVTLFETYCSQDLFRPEAAPRVDKLSGMCRSIQRAVVDIKKIAHRAQQQRQNTSISDEDTVLRHMESNLRCSDTVRALVEYSAEPKEA